MPDYKSFQEIREIERLYLDFVRKAENCIYIENQYTTSHRIGTALAERLQERDGPEVIVVTLMESSGWLEQNTMDVIRSRWIRCLRESVRYGRFRIYYPHLPDYERQQLTVHSKLIVVDDRLFQVGSANLCNRSMGLDSECNLAISAGADDEVKSTIQRFRTELLSEHCGVTPDEFTRTAGRHDSLREVIDSFQASERSLRDLDGTVPDWRDRQVPHSSMIDPEKTVDSDWFRDQLVPEESSRNAVWSSLKFILMIVMFLGMAAAWRWSPLSRFADIDNLMALIEIWRENAMLPVVLIGGFVIGGCIGMPVTLLVTIMAVIYQPWKAFLLSYASIMLSSSVSFWIGSFVGKEFIDQHAGKKIKDISQKVAHQGVLFLALLRLLPIAPFTVINTVGGASHVKFRDYFLGTLLGAIPGTLAVTLFIERLTIAAQDPRPRHFIIASAIGLVFIGTTWIFGRWVRGRSKKKT